MRSFTYQYKGETVESLWAVSVEGGHLHYKVKLGDDLWITIVPTHLSGPDDKITWLQSDKQDEIVQPQDLLEAMGAGLEDFLS